MADRSIVVRLRAEIADFRRGMREASDAVEQNRQHIDQLSNQAGLMGAAMVAGALVSVRAWANFDEAMSHVQAATHATGAEMQALTDAALKAGLSTQYSATQAAGAIEELARAGVAASDIIGGGLAGALSLAAAGGLSVEESAEIAATALKTFGLEGNKVEHVADLMAAGAGKAQGSVHQLGMALKQSALVANATGLTIEETTAGLGAFASAGLLGSDAGTSFKSMLQRLTPQSAEAQRMMDELGISAYDANGQFVGLANFAGNLQNSLKGLTAEQRNAAMATIFGSDAVRAANVLYTEGATGIQNWTDKVNDAGYAAETARLRMDNLKGDITTLKGAFENAMIGMGSSSDGVLRGLVQQITDVIRAFAGLEPGVQAATLAIIGGGGLVLLGVAGMGKLIVSINNTRLAMAALGLSAKTAAASAGAIGLIVAVAATAVGKWAQKSAELKQRTDDLAGSLDQATGAITTNTRAVVYNQLQQAGLIKKAKEMGLDLGDVVTAAIDPTSDAMNRLTSRYQEAADATREVAGANSNVFAKGLTEATAKSAGLDEVLRGVKGTSEEVAAAQAEVADQTAAGVTQTDAAAGSMEELGSTYDLTTRAIQEQVVTLAELVSAQNEAAGLVLSVRDAQRAFEASVDDVTAALEANGATLDASTEQGRANQQALDDIAESGWGLVESMAANGSTQEELQGTMQTTRDRFVEAAQQFGMTADEAAALADQLKLIPADVKTTASIDATQARSTADDMRAKYDGLGRPIKTIMTLQVEGYERARAMYDGLGRPLQSTPSPPGYASGGYTGDYGTNDVAGVVHGREYVIKADTVAQQPRSYWDNLNAGRFSSPAQPSSTRSSSAAGGSNVTATFNIETTDPIGAAIAANRRLATLGRI